MSAEYITLAATVVTSFLLPYIKMGAEEFLAEIASKSGKNIAQHTLEITEKVWDRVKSVFNSEGDQVTLEYFQKNPEKFQEEMQESLTLKLKADGKLMASLTELIHSKLSNDGQTASDVITTTINVRVRGNVFKNVGEVNISGQQNKE